MYFGVIQMKKHMPAIANAQAWAHAFMPQKTAKESNVINWLLLSQAALRCVCVC